MRINYYFSAPYRINNPNAISPKINYLNNLNSDYFLAGYELRHDTNKIIF